MGWGAVRRSATCAGVLAAALAVGACETSLVSPSYDGAAELDNRAGKRGWTYYLPTRTFRITLGVTLVSCGVAEDDTATFGYEATAAVEDVMMADHGAAFIIDSEDLASGSKVTTATLALYPNGTLKSINAAAEDRTAQIAGNIVRTGLVLASAASGVPLPTGTYNLYEADDEKDLCHPEVTKALAEIASLKARLAQSRAADDSAGRKTLLTQLDREKTVLQALETQLAKALEAGDDAAVKAAHDTRESQKTVVAGLAAQTKSDTPGLTAKLAKERAKLTRTIQFDWVPSTASEQTEKACVRNSVAHCLKPSFVRAFSGRVVREWLTVDGAQTLATQCLSNPTPECRALVDADVDNPRDVWDVFRPVALDIRLYAPDWSPLVENSDADLSSNTEGGVVYRQPRMAKLEVCKRGCGADLGDAPLVSKLYSMPQFGRVGRLDLENGVFGDDTLAATFGADGTLLTATYTSAAEFEAASKLLLDTATGAAGLVDARREKRDGALAREVDQIKLQTQRYQELKNLEDAKRAYENAIAPIDDPVLSE
jgi:hypothetical protein